MKTLRLLLICYLGMTAAVSARIGETPEEITKRYGPTLSPATESRGERHRKDGIDVEVRYYQGKCAQIRFFSERTSKDEAVFSQNQITGLLFLNAAPKVEWSEVNPYVDPLGNKHTELESDDKLLVARILRHGPFLAGVMIETKEFRAVQVNEAKLEAIRSMPGF